MSENSTNMTSVSRITRLHTVRTTLLHPVFWAALAILIVNDHVLKGAGLLPALLTGKLSDLAGLIVAPWLVVATFGALGARTRAARTLAFALVVLPFALTKASPMCAAWLDLAMRALGLGWRTWSDPTDLVALAVLPLTWHLTTPRAARPSQSAARALERAGVVLGAAACLATSRAPEPTPANIVTTAWVLNRTGEPITLRVHWAEADIDCDAIAGRGVRAATRGVFGGGTSFAVPANGVVGLADIMRVPGAPDPFLCQVVLLQADGLDDTVVAWSSLAQTFMPNMRPAGDDGDPLGRVTLVRRDTELVPLAGTDVEVGDLALLAPRSSCPRATGESVEWSSSLDERSGNVHRIESIDVGPDGCFGLELTSEYDARTRSFFLCVPGFAVPFAAGTLVQIYETRVDAGPGRLLRMESVEGEAAEGAAMTIYAGVERLALAALAVSLEPASCDGERQECGALTLPARGIVSYDGVLTTLEPGESTLFDVSVDLVGVRSRLFYARGERVIFAPDSCESTRADAHLYGDFVLTTYGSGGAP